ncbi:hypothetical protein IHN32_01410 [Deinococcus sp. 14RED07]|uniref:hypothetical protein n=1 Tax=unclassified Deinococcus TaxID=2623546 RepID=UPI001E521A0D|nr:MULTISPECIES: hypothetical protein [unclassified Deinococcus]MCD0157043.1 hypothetical protein [Deinococcus sp. 6GRE01]MCD0164689.1 hypothetical protein [Deinococcus sp. 12RED42]MCD0174611.1 hypothetical protein [Deinococcus sp. 14RED07]
MNRHDLANLEQLALLREALQAESTRPEDVTEPAQPASELAVPDSPDTDPEPLSPGRHGLTRN